jgi:hypothetical protein
MPKPETYFEQQVGDGRVVVLKTYDAGFAREAFDLMDEDAVRFLAKTLDVDSHHEDEPSPPG